MKEQKKTTAQWQAMYARVLDAIEDYTTKDEKDDLLSRFPERAKTDKTWTIKARAKETDQMMAGIAEEINEETQERFCKRHSVRFDCDHEVRGLVTVPLQACLALIITCVSTQVPLFSL